MLINKHMSTGGFLKIRLYVYKRDKCSTGVKIQYFKTTDTSVVIRYIHVRIVLFLFQPWFNTSVRNAEVAYQLKACKALKFCSSNRKDWLAKWGFAHCNAMVTTCWTLSVAGTCTHIFQKGIDPLPFYPQTPHVHSWLVLTAFGYYYYFSLNIMR